MKYISTGTWRDLTDMHLYHEGDLFPFDGREVDQKRLDELENGTNRAGLVLIRAVEVKKNTDDKPQEKEPVKEPKAGTTAKKATAKKTTKK